MFEFREDFKVLREFFVRSYWETLSLDVGKDLWRVAENHEFPWLYGIL